MKYICILFFLIILSGSGKALAQKAAVPDTSYTRAQAVYFEVLGPGLLYSINYDTRFKKSKKQDGLGMRVGISYANVEALSLFTLPVQLNYLLGSNEKFFEIGAGATFATARLDLFSDSDNNTGSTVIGTLNFGYRKQPKNAGFLFKAGSTIIFGSGFFIPYYAHVAFGYKF